MSITVGGKTISGGASRVQGTTGSFTGSVGKTSSSSSGGSSSVQPQNIPGAIASTVLPGGQPGVIISPQTPEQALVASPDIVASSRNQGQYIASSGEKVTPVASVQTPYGGGVAVKYQAQPYQSPAPAVVSSSGVSNEQVRQAFASTPEGQFVSNPSNFLLNAPASVSRQASEGYGYLSTQASVLQQSGLQRGLEGQRSGNVVGAVGGAFEYAAGSVGKGVGNVGEAYFGQKASLGKLAPVSYAADIGAPALGEFVGGTYVFPIAARAVGTSVVAGEGLAAAGLGLGVVGAVDVARSSQTKEGAAATVGQAYVPFTKVPIPFVSNVQLGGFVGGVAEGVFSNPDFGLKLTSSKFGKATVVEQRGGAVGFGEAGVPSGTLQATVEQRGVARYSYFGKQLPPTQVVSSKTFQLVPTESGVSSGRVYAQSTFKNPLTGRDIVESGVFEAQQRGSTLVEVSPSGLFGRVTKQTSSRILGTTPTGETIRVSYGRSVPFESDLFGNVNILRGERRASIANEQRFNQGGGLVGSPSTAFTSSGDVLLSTGERSFVRGRETVFGEGFAGRTTGGTSRASTPSGIEFAREQGLVARAPEPSVPLSDRFGGRAPLSRSRSGELSVTSLERPEVITRSPSRSVDVDIGLVGIDRPGLDLGIGSSRLVGSGLIGGARPSVGSSVGVSSVVSPSRVVSPRIDPALISAPVPVSGQRITPTQVVKPLSTSASRLSTDARYGVSLVPPPSLAVPPPPDVPFGGLPFKTLPGGGGRGGRSGVGAGRKSQYAPDFTAGFFGQRAGKTTQRVGGESLINPVLRRLL